MIRLTLGDRLPREQATAMDSVQEYVAAPDPKECPICWARPPFEPLKDGEHFLCYRCGFAFEVDDKGELVTFWATNKSRPEEGLKC